MGLKAPPGSAEPPGVDSGSIVLGWLTRVTLVLSAMALLVFDGMALATTRVSLEHRAGDAAAAAAHRWATTKDHGQAYDAAVTSVTEDGQTGTIVPESFVVEPDGTVTVSIEDVPTTLLLHHVPRLEDALTLRGDGRARPAP